jgi:hypothetical protein
MKVMLYLRCMNYVFMSLHGLTYHLFIVCMHTLHEFIELSPQGLELVFMTLVWRRLSFLGLRATHAYSSHEKCHVCLFLIINI